MTRPAAYDPEPGCMYQIFCRFDTRTWEHCDYAIDREDKKHLLKEYRMAYPGGYEFKVVTLPKKYWASH